MDKDKHGYLFLISAFLLVSPTSAAEFRAGVARVDITPASPIWMAGYGDRTHPSTGISQRLWVKALAIEDAKSSVVVILTADLIGLPRTITDEVAARASKEYNVDRSRLVFNASHIHTGPVVMHVLPTMFELAPEELRVGEEYSRKLSEDLFTAIGAALGHLSPVDIAYGEGQAHFAINRREPTPQGIRIGVNPKGPVDPAVPVLRVRGTGGDLLAVLFGYACHNTTLGGDFYQLNGDYAGYAQLELEQDHPGTTAMFLMLSGGDQNPDPRGSVALAADHGRSLATEVNRVLNTNLTPVRQPIRTSFQNVELEFALHTRETFENELRESKGAKRRRAQAMLQAYDDRHPVRQILYPVQAIRFSTQLTILALGGETVVDYSLRAKREYPGNLIVAGYSNDVMSYIPSERMLHEGGYEVVDSMMYYGLPGPYAGDVEERVFDGIHRVMKSVGLKSSKTP